MVASDDYPVAIVAVPTAMPSSIMTVEFTSAIVVMVAIVMVGADADVETETLSACHCWRCNGDGC